MMRGNEADGDGEERRMRHVEGQLSLILKWVMAEQLITADIFTSLCELCTEECLN